MPYSDTRRPRSRRHSHEPPGLVPGSVQQRAVDAVQFTLIELHIDKNGKGEGKLVPAAKVSWDTKAKKIEIDNYNALPVDLINVTAKTP